MRYVFFVYYRRDNIRKRERERERERKREKEREREREREKDILSSSCFLGSKILES